jgi:hypothetical protein
LGRLSRANALAIAIAAMPGDGLTYGDVLKKYLRLVSLTPREFAKDVGAKLGSVRDWLSGKRLPIEPTAQRIEEVLLSRLGNSSSDLTLALRIAWFRRADKTLNPGTSKQHALTWAAALAMLRSCDENALPIDCPLLLPVYAGMSEETGSPRSIEGRFQVVQFVLRAEMGKSATRLRWRTRRAIVRTADSDFRLASQSHFTPNSGPKRTLLLVPTGPKAILLSRTAHEMSTVRLGDVELLYIEAPS